MTSPYDGRRSVVVGKSDEAEKQFDWTDVEGEDDNMLLKLDWPRLQRKFLEDLQTRTDDIKRIVSQHVYLRPGQQCTVAQPSDWICGSFNVCVPIRISGPTSQRLLIKCPQPHRLGGLVDTRLLDEKLRCEAASFAWISQDCPRVPIPGLWGFGLPNGLTFTSVSRLPWYFRAFEYLKRGLAYVLGKPFCRPFVPHRRSASLKSGYLMDFIDKKQGTMLSNLWPLRADAVEQRRNLYKSLSRVMLDLARPSDKIGSFTIDNSGEMSLSHRPLTLQLATLENEGIPTQISPNTCYSTTDSYLHDLLHCHDLKLRYQPNAVRSQSDAEGQMAVLTIMRSLTADFTQRDLRHGPFVYQFTDLHPSNIFVDQQCNITGIVDLEWSCFLPIETQHPPFWLSGHELDELEGENTIDFDNMCREFLEIFEEEDRSTARYSPLESGFCTAVMKAALKKKTHWYWSSLKEPRGMYNLFFEHIQPLFAPFQSKGESAIWFQDIITPYWSTDASALANDKTRHRQEYLEQLRAKR